MEKILYEWLTIVWAMVMRNLFPILSVKYCTKKQKGCMINPYASKFLPTVEKQLAAIKKLGLTGGELLDRVWSKETKAALFKEGNYALTDTVASDDREYFMDEVVRTKNAKIIAGFFKRMTPTKDYLKRFVKEHTELAMAVAKQQPNIFNNLNSDELPEVLFSSFLQQDLNSTDEAGRWVKGFYDILRTKQSGNLEQAKHFDDVMKLLMNVNYNFANDLANLQKYHPVWYAAIRDKSEDSPHFADYLVERLPRLVKAITPSAGQNSKKYKGKDIPEAKEVWAWLAKLAEAIPLVGQSRKEYEGKDLSAAQDVVAWLYHAMKKIASAEVQKVLLDNLPIGNNFHVWSRIREELLKHLTQFETIAKALEKMPSKYEPELKKRLFESISNAKEAQKALELLDENQREAILQKMVSTATSGDASVLVKYFPFGGFPQETAILAIKKLIDYGRLPLERLAELDEVLTSVAKEYSEVKMEIKDLGKSLRPKNKLHEESEVYFFTHNVSLLRAAGCQYVRDYKLSGKGFAVLVSTKSVNGENVETLFKEMLKTYVEKHGLDMTEYIALCNSDYKDYAKEIQPE